MLSVRHGQAFFVRHAHGDKAQSSLVTNLTLHHAIAINKLIGCGDAPVWPGDIVAGDAEGVIVIPAGIADEMKDEAVKMTAFEDFVQKNALQGRSILGLYPPPWRVPKSR